MSSVLRILFNKPFTIVYVYLKKEVATSPVKHDCFCCSSICSHVSYVYYFVCTGEHCLPLCYMSCIAQGPIGICF